MGVAVAGGVAVARGAAEGARSQRWGRGHNAGGVVWELEGRGFGAVGVASAVAGARAGARTQQGAAR